MAKFWLAATRRYVDEIAREGGLPCTGTTLTLAPAERPDVLVTVTVQLIGEDIGGMFRTLSDAEMRDMSSVVQLHKYANCGCSLGP